MAFKKYAEIDNLDRLFQFYNKMKSRCYKRTDARYRFIGGKGIKVCEEWNDSLENFYEWAIDNGYQPDLYLERINQDEDFSPDNCIWVDKYERIRKKKEKHWRTYEGETYIVADWARLYGIPASLLNSRLRRGWEFKDAIYKDTRKYKKSK